MRFGGKHLSVKRPPRRYIGLAFEPKAATRREVTRAIEAAFLAGPSGAGQAVPRLLVCEEGAAIVLVARGEERRARQALQQAPASGLRLVPVVTSGTIAAVKKRLRVAAGDPRQSKKPRP